MSRNRSFITLICSLTLASVPALSLADTIEQQHFRISGFGTLGAVKSGDDILGFTQGLYQEGVFDGDWSYKSNSNLGLQLDATFNNRLSATFQLVAKERVENGLEESLEWAFLRFRATQSVTLRAGRLGPSNFMLSDYRNIGFAYLWVRPPTEFYNILSFDYIDGMDVAYSTPLGTGTASAKFQVGKTSSTFARSDNRYDVNINPIYLGTLVWENDLWQTQASVALIEFDSDKYVAGTKELAQLLEGLGGLWPASESYLEGMKSDGRHTRYYSFGIAYTPENWQIQSEMSYIDTNVELYGSLRTGYLSVGRHIGPTTAYVMLAKAERGEDRKTIEPAPTVGPPLQPLLDVLQVNTQYVYDATQVNQQSASLGLRWNILYNLAAKTQWDRTWVEAYGGGFWDQKAIPTEDTTIDTFTINLNYVF
ncbi:MAG: hypothetical protein VYA55_00650 [Pseudomonadota bacterium]|nr:hypothetical protein [Pseudomonadota bacterium]